MLCFIGSRWLGADCLIEKNVPPGKQNVYKTRLPTAGWQDIETCMHGLHVIQAQLFVVQCTLTLIRLLVNL